MKINIIALLLLFSFVAKAQKEWTLEECINHALEKNINIKQSELNASIAKNNLLQSKMDLYSPLVSAGVSHNFNFSNSVDPLTFQFVTQNTQSTVFSLNGNYSIFEGMSRINNIEANKHDMNATAMEIEEVKNNTKLLITNLYLQNLIAQEVYQISKERQKLTQNQMTNTQELVKAGVLARGDLLEVEAQKANDELAVINAENNLERVSNQLKTALQISPFEPFSIAKISLEQNPQNELLNPQLVVSNSLQNMPNVKATKYRLLSAENRLKAARGSLSPTLSISARIGTNYFSLAQQQSGSTNLGRVPVGTVGQGGPLVLSLNEINQPNFERIGYGEQLNRNTNESLSLNFNVTIFGKWQRMIAIDNAKINILNAQYSIENKKNQLQEESFNAYTDLKAAAKRYDAANKNMSASLEAFKYAEEKYKVGLLNSLEFETVKNRLTSTQADFIQAKYEYAFRKMIFDFYQTGTLKL
jgi:outer membrane protein